MNMGKLETDGQNDGIPERQHRDARPPRASGTNSCARRHRYPGVVGLEPHIKDVTNRFAAEGFVALAPDLYHGKIATEPDEACKLAMELEYDHAVAKIVAAARFLLARDDVRGPTVGVVGF